MTYRVVRPVKSPMGEVREIAVGPAYATREEAQRVAVRIGGGAKVVAS